MRASNEIDDFGFDLVDVENYRGEAENKYSHQVLVMEQLRRTLQALSQEMKKGWEERKEDKTGTVMSIKSHPDTRKEAAENIKTLKNILIGYIEDDKEQSKSIPKLLLKIDELLQQFVELEQKEWDSIPSSLKHPTSRWLNRWDHIPGTLNYDYIYGEKYLQKSMDLWRNVLEEIMRLLHKMQYFEAKHVRRVHGSGE